MDGKKSTIRQNHMNVFIYFLFDSLFELENSPHKFSSIGNLVTGKERIKTIKKKSILA